MSDQVTRSQSGKVVAQATYGVDAYPAGPNFAYDGAGRLTTARVPGHTYTYEFAPSGACGAPPSATNPYGQALAGLPDNSAGNMDYGWLGQHQRPLEHATGIATIEMGARQYVPGLGRFLEVDPV